MLFSLLSPQRKLIDAETIDELFVPGVMAQLNILENHANLVSKLETGMVRWRQGTTWHKAVISTGLVEVFDNHVTVMADVAELAEEIDVNRAKSALERARKKLDEGGLDDATYRKQELKLKRAMARSEVSAR